MLIFIEVVMVIIGGKAMAALLVSAPSFINQLYHHFVVSITPLDAAKGQAGRQNKIER